MGQQAAPVRDAILDAAERLLGRFGYGKTTVAEIAREAGIGKGTIYLHLPSKKEVALGTIDRLVDRVVERLERIAASEAPAADRLRRILRSRVTLRLDGVQHYAGRIDELLVGIRPELLARRREHFRREAAVVEAVLESGRAAGELRVDDPAAAARAMIAATNSLLPYDLSVEDLHRKRELARLTERIADLLLHGVTAPAASRGVRSTRSTPVPP